MAWAAAALAVSAVSSAYGASEQKKATSAANAANLAAQERAREQMRLWIAKGEGAAGQGIREAEKGFAQATKSLGVIGQGARRRILRRETAVLGRADAEAANRGMYNSTRALNAKRAVRSDTNLNLSAVDESLASLHSQLFRDRAKTLMQGHMAKMSLYSMGSQQAVGIEGSVIHQAGNVGGAWGAAGGSLAKLLMTNSLAGETEGAGDQGWPGPPWK